MPAVYAARGQFQKVCSTMLDSEEIALGLNFPFLIRRLRSKFSAGLASALRPVPTLGTSSAELPRELGSSVGRAPAVILVGIAAGAFPETLSRLPRVIYCSSGQMLYYSGA
jgi:hypothetical protein